MEFVHPQVLMDGSRSSTDFVTDIHALCLSYFIIENYDTVVVD